MQTSLIKFFCVLSDFVSTDSANESMKIRILNIRMKHLQRKILVWWKYYLCQTSSDINRTWKTLWKVENNCLEQPNLFSYISVNPL